MTLFINIPRLKRYRSLFIAEVDRLNDARDTRDARSWMLPGETRDN